MGAHTLKHLQSQIQILLSEIIFSEVENKLARNATITEVVVTKDLSFATVYVTFPSNSKESLNALKNIATMIRQKLSQALSTYKVPFLKFELDTMLDKINHLEKKFEEMKINDNLKKEKITKSKKPTTKKVAKKTDKKVVKAKITRKKTK